MKPKLTGQTTWSYYDRPPRPVLSSGWCCWCEQTFEIQTDKVDSYTHVCRGCGGETIVRVDMHIHVGVGIFPASPPPSPGAGEDRTTEHRSVSPKEEST